MLPVLAALMFLLWSWLGVSWFSHAIRDYAGPERSLETDSADSGQGMLEREDGAVKNPSSDFRLDRLPDGRTAVTEAVKTSAILALEEAQPQADLEAIDAIFGLYRWAYKENPEGGDNREIVAALLGDNPRKLVFIPENHPLLSDSGELLDRWGTSYFFHKISDQVIDVTSAGPDRRQWSSDDLTLGYTESYQAATNQ